METTRRTRTVDLPCPSRLSRRPVPAVGLVAAVAALWLAGCSGASGDPAPVPAPANHAISGSISGPGAAGATVLLSGASEAAVQADDAGRYSFAELADGGYTVTASRTGYTFAPATHPVTVAGSDVAGQDFVAAAGGGHTIAGAVTGAVASGVRLALTGPGVVATAATTGDGGAYRFDGYPDGEYTVTPSLAGYLFSPTSRVVNVAAGDVAGEDFTAAPAGTTATVDRIELAAPSAAIGGPALEYSAVVTNWTGSGLADVAVQAWIEQGEARRQAGWAAVGEPCAPPGAPGLLLTGTCTFGASLAADNEATGSGTLVPGYATLVVELVQGGATVLHTVSVEILLVRSHAISGRISGATAVSLSVEAAVGGASWGLYTGGADTYTVSGLPPGLYTVTPSREGYGFSPASRQVDLASLDATAVDFSAARSGAVFTLDRLELESATATIDGPRVGYTAILTNWTAAPLSAVIQNWIEQGSARRAANGATFTERPGTTAEWYAFGPSNTGYGTGTLVPGSAELVVEVTPNGYVTQIYRYPITLQ